MHNAVTAPSARSDWLIPVLLILFGIVPAIGGIVRMVDLAPGTLVTASNARFHAAPIPIVLHVLTALPFAFLGALQFSPALRRRGNRWHRIAGRMVAPFGLVAALTGLWMAQFYPWPPADGTLVYLERVVFSVGMFVALVLALLAVRRREFKAHGDWMIRGYAIGMGAATQVLTHLPWFILIDLEPAGLPRAVMMGAGWMLNVLVAERIIRARTTAARPHPVLARQSQPAIAV